MSDGLHCGADRLEAALDDRVGRPRRVTDHSRHGSAATVERVDGPHGTAWRKRHATTAAFDAEVRGLHALRAPLRRVGIELPPLWAADRDATTVLLGHLPGEAPATDDLHAHRRAGAGVEALRALPCPPDPLPLERAIARRLQRARARAAAHLSASLLQGAVARAKPEAFAETSRCWAHRDCAPRNWLVDGGRLAWLDLERCRPDAPEADLLMVAVGSPTACFEAFAEAAGWSGASDGAARLDTLALLFALDSVGWAKRHADATYLALGERLLSGLARGLSAHAAAIDAAVGPR